MNTQILKPAEDPSGADQFGYRLRLARTARSLSQQQLASALGITQATVSRYENNVDRPRGEQLQQLLVVLELNWEWLLYGRGEMDAARHLSGEVLEIARRLDALPPELREQWMKSLLHGLPPALARKA